MAKTSGFISYSHVDEDYLKRLKVHLKPLERIYAFEAWDDRRIKPGQKWKDEIESAIQRSKVIILLLSADFLASDFVMEKEYPEALRKANEEGAQIVSVFVSPCMIEEFEIGDYQAVNSPDETLQDFGSADLAAKQERIYVDAARVIRDMLKAADKDSKQ